MGGFLKKVSRLTTVCLEPDCGEQLPAPRFLRSPLLGKELSPRIKEHSHARLFQEYASVRQGFERQKKREGLAEPAGYILNQAAIL